MSRSFGSQGFSLKATGAGDDSTSLKYQQDHDEDDNTIFGQRCGQGVRCGPVTCYSFKSRNDCLFCCSIILMIVALFIGVIGPLVINSIIDDTINSQVIIDSTSSPSFEVWQTNAEGEGMKNSIQFDIYCFDIQNPDEILAGAKPVVVEKGPYAYDEYFYKFDIEWIDDGDTVIYNKRKWYVFNQARSGPGLSETDLITMPYTTVAGFMFTLDKIPASATLLLDIFLEDAIYGVLNSTLAYLDLLTDWVEENIRVPSAKNAALAQIAALEATVEATTQELIDFVEISNPADLFLKVILAGVPSGISPFWKVTPREAYFGWLNDPVLASITPIINNVVNITGEYIGWTTAVPSSMTNHTSIEDCRRRRQRDMYKTGKKNIHQVGQFVRYQNMSLTWACVAPMNSQIPTEYEEGKEFPACELFQNDWTPAIAKKRGYQQPFMTDYANNVGGYNGEQFGRPFTNDFVRAYSGDVYRSSYFEHTGDVELYGLNLKRYQLQTKDLLNCSQNPENCQYCNYNQPKGMGNVTLAVNAPIYIANAHFCDADPSLVSAVVGMQPVPEIHRTYLDIEPVTGQLARVMHAVMEVVKLDSLFIVALNQDAATNTALLCGQIQDLIVFINSTDYNGTLPTISCNLTTATKLLNTLALPSNWTLQNDRIFFPYAYCREQNQMTQEDANDLQAQLFDTMDFVSALQRYSLMIAGALFVLNCVMYYTLYRSDADEDYLRAAKRRNSLDKSNVDALNPLLADQMTATTGFT